MNLSRQVKVLIGSWLLLAAFLALSRPGGLPVVVLILPFVLLFAALYGSWNFLLQLKIRYSARGRPHPRLGAAVCVSIVLLLVLQSIGQLSLRDVVIVAALVALGYIYTGRTALGAHPD
ncbi:MAG TPA: hypothetical protein VGM08_03105 [Candidatus Saccharimonadales bacterium]|jgi:hypothetical protein